MPTHDSYKESFIGMDMQQTQHLQSINRFGSKALDRNEIEHFCGLEIVYTNSRSNAM